MNPALLATKAKFLLNQNASVILTGVGVAGSVGTALLTARSTFKAARMIDGQQIQNAVDKIKESEANNGTRSVPSFDKLSKTEATKLVWKCYIPPVILGTITVGSIIFAHRVDAKKIMALTVASGVSERALKEYKDKVVEKIGPRQEGKIRDEVAQDRVNQSYDNYGEHYPVREGKILCMEVLTGRYFDSTPEEMQKAINNVNSEMLKDDGVALSRFFDQVGLSPSAYSDEVGWNPIELVNLSTSAALTPDGRPCLVVDFAPRPFPNFLDLH